MAAQRPRRSTSRTAGEADTDTPPASGADAKKPRAKASGAPTRGQSGKKQGNGAAGRAAATPSAPRGETPGSTAFPMGELRDATEPWLTILSGTRLEQVAGLAWEYRVLGATSDNPEDPDATWLCAVKSTGAGDAFDVVETRIGDINGVIMHRDPAVPDSAIPARMLATLMDSPGINALEAADPVSPPASSSPNAPSAAVDVPATTGSEQVLTESGLQLRPERAWRRATTSSPEKSNPPSPGMDEARPVVAHPATEVTAAQAPDPPDVPVVPASGREVALVKSAPRALPVSSRASVADPAIAVLDDRAVASGASARRVARADPPMAYEERHARRAPRWMVGIGAAAVVVVLALAIAAPGFLAPAGSGRDGSGPPAIPPTPSLGSAVGGAIEVQETFDALPMDSELPPPWAVRGTGLGDARIVALPTSVDRSARVRSGTDGGATIACLSSGRMSSAEVAISFDYRLGRAASTATLLSLQLEGTRTLSLAVDASGRPLGVAFGEVQPSGAPAASGSPSAGAPAGSAGEGWQRLVLTIRPAVGELAWRGEDETGAVTGEGREVLADGDAATFDSVCFHSPEGAPDGWVVIDDLVVSA